MNQPGGKLQDQVAVVTGAARGMGRAIAGALAGEGARVVVTDVDGEGVRRAAEGLDPGGTRVLWFKTDVTREDEVAGMVDRTLEAFGTVTVLVNNAGVLLSTRVDEITKAEWDRVLDVNLNGTFLCTAAVLPIMKKNGYGRIVNLSSSAGRSVSTLGGAHYTTSKAAVLGFTRALAREMAPHGITANAVCPGLIDTEMVRQNCSPERLRAYERSFPVSRLGTPEEVARLVVFLCADADYITGASIDINGGDLMV